MIEGRREPLTVPAGTPVPVMLAERLHSKTAQPGQEISFCVAEDVRIGDEFKGGLDPGAFIGAGVFGFLSYGRRTTSASISK